VRDVGLRTGSDAHVWEDATTKGFTIVSKDTDFRERSFVEGFPPKVVWLDVGNAGTTEIAALLHKERARSNYRKKAGPIGVRPSNIPRFGGMATLSS